MVGTRSEEETAPRQSDAHIAAERPPAMMGSRSHGYWVISEVTHMTGHKRNQGRAGRSRKRSAPYAQHFSPKVRQALPGSRSLLWLVGITKSKRSLYDHCILHELGKRDTKW